MLVDMQEEYTSKLMILQEKHETHVHRLVGESASTQRRNEQLRAQLECMEKKEMRLFGQLAEARQQWEEEARDKEQRTRELEELLFKKEEDVNELEREVRTKDKTLHERQEQIAILIGALEAEHSQDEARQKLLNLAAELCSLKAI